MEALAGRSGRLPAASGAARGDLLAAVSAAAAGNAVLSPGVTRTVIARMLAGLPASPRARPQPPRLRRETAVLRGIGSGLSNAEIAADLFLSESTVSDAVSKRLAKRTAV